MDSNERGSQQTNPWVKPRQGSREGMGGRSFSSWYEPILKSIVGFTTIEGAFQRILPPFKGRHMKHAQTSKHTPISLKANS
jgi:hypothetical protein